MPNAGHIIGRGVGLGLGLGALLLLGCGGEGSSTDEALPDDDSGELQCGDATLAGHVVIQGEDDLAQLEGIAVIEGELQLDRTSFTALDFLGCVEEVGGQLTIFGNTALVDLGGLDRLTDLQEGLVISENPALTELRGLDRLVEVGDSVVIRNNAALRAIDGLTGLTGIEASLIIRDNDVLEHIDGLRGLRRVGALFAVTHNPELCITSVNEVGEGIVDPATPREGWSTRANDEGC